MLLLVAVFLIINKLNKTLINTVKQNKTLINIMNKQQKTLISIMNKTTENTFQYYQ